MKQVKIEYEKCRKKMPHRPPDEIDFGLGFRAALRWTKSLLETHSNSGGGIIDYVNQELQ